MHTFKIRLVWATLFIGLLFAVPYSTAQIGKEVAIAQHLADGEEFALSLNDLLAHGKALFTANWTTQEGGGRPLTKGTGTPLVNPTNPLVFPFNFNRISAPDANSCAGCHNVPAVGGGGDIVANVFVLGHRFDFLTFDHSQVLPTEAAIDESGSFATLQSAANSRNTLGMFGAGFIEMLARQMTADLQAIRDTVGPGQSKPLTSKGVSFGVIARDGAGNWVTSGVYGLTSSSLAGNPPNLIIRPFHQAAAVISLRQFTNNAFNHHHGIQSTERFGAGDPDGDGFTNEITRADITAASVFQATLPVPGRVIPDDAQIEQAVLLGESRFSSIGCVGCHIPALPLTNESWVFSEPNPYNPAGNLRPVDGVPPLAVDLTSKKLPGPRLEASDGVSWVPAFTDLRVHDITSGPGDPNREPLDMHQSGVGLFAGNGSFITRKLWGVANEPPFFHHGQYTTMRQAILAHAGAALTQRNAFAALPAAEQDAIIEFLKTLQVLPPGTKWLVVNEKGHQKKWPPPAGK